MSYHYHHYCHGHYCYCLAALRRMHTVYPGARMRIWAEHERRPQELLPSLMTLARPSCAMSFSSLHAEKAPLSGGTDTSTVFFGCLPTALRRRTSPCTTKHAVYRERRQFSVCIHRRRPRPLLLRFVSLANPARKVRLPHSETPRGRPKPQLTKQMRASSLLSVYTSACTRADI